MTDARKAAFVASIKWKTIPVEKKLVQWIEKESPKQSDIALAKEIANGTVKRWVSLCYMAKKILPKLSSFSEKLLILQAIYQLSFLDTLPSYAIVNETVNIAKKHFGKKKASFFNAILRNLDQKLLVLPKDNLSIFYSFPKEFVEMLSSHFSKKKVEEILSNSNRHFLPSCRVRKDIADTFLDKEKGFHLLYQNKLCSIQIEDKKLVSRLAANKDFYIQNVTYSYFLDKLASFCNKSPATIIDLCASPGGKAIGVHDLYPTAKLVVNDISEAKRRVLQENMEKYEIEVKITMTEAEKYPTSTLYDLVIVDAPCSGSGVLGKRAEARHRINRKKITEYSTLQLAIVKRASKLVGKDGQIWYITCSILPEENEKIVEKATGLTCIYSYTILPTNDGWDGGFAACLQRK